MADNDAGRWQGPLCGRTPTVTSLITKGERDLRRRIALIGTALAALLALSACGKIPTPTTQRWSSPPAMQIDTSKTYTATVQTNYGPFTISLFAKQDPVAVNNFVFLANHNFFVGDRFFRILKSFVIQTGDPLNNGTGGPGYQWKDELPPTYPYGPGIVAMANAGTNTNGSQFFVCTGSQSQQLNNSPLYTEFGRVISGMPVVLKIADIPVKANPVTQEDSYPTRTAWIKRVTISVS